MATIYVTDRAGREHGLAAKEGKKVMEIIRDAGLPIEAICGGCCACSTCHVYVEPAWLAKLAPQQDDEIDTLELAFDVQDNSRLSCQIPFRAELDGLRLTLAPT
ncbi:MAG: 2Fe-2S iron-sulfur cluster-binding protein [Gammaproteobacteria bacterium]